MPIKSFPRPASAEQVEPSLYWRMSWMVAVQRSTTSSSIGAYGVALA